jgi:hypothetical protein
MESLTLTTPETKPAINTTDYRVVFLSLDWEQARITIRVRGTNAESKGFLYEGGTALTLMTALNKIDLSIKSLQRRILERLIADGLLLGSIAGVPD